MTPASPGSDSALVGGRWPEGVEELVEWTKTQLSVPADTAWRLIGARTKLKKILFEVEETSPRRVRRLIAKVVESNRGQYAFTAMRQLWDAGFRPPAEYTVTEPVAWLPERKMLLAERAPGVMLLESIRRRSPDAMRQAEHGARWLATLHRSQIPAPAWKGPADVIDRCENELSRHLPAHASRIERIASCLRAGFGEDRPLVPSHGDFHPMNIFLDPARRVTVIDLDTFSERERAADVGYFQAQTMIMGWLEFRSFDSTAELRAAFLHAYNAAAGSLPDPERVELYRSLAFLQSLHFERCILHTGNGGIIEPWLTEAEACC